jgi:enediyne biosynthesis protein E5
MAMTTSSSPAITAKAAIDFRIAALRRFALAITALTILGHLVLGFETSYAHPFVAVLTAYSFELGLEWLDAVLHGRTPAFLGAGLSRAVDFLLPAHITALACAMLLFSGETFTPLIFAVTVGVCSKYIFRAPLGRGKSGHFLNPSNTGITAALIVFPWVGIAPPYQFTENVSGIWDWVVPGIVVCTGSLLNWRLTGKLPLITAWLAGFAAQAIIRATFLPNDFRLLHALSPMTGMAFVLFTYYMVTDPGTTPFRHRNQVIFGLSVALVYLLLDVANVPYQLFLALFAVCCVRGVQLFLSAYLVAPRDGLATMAARLVGYRRPRPGAVARIDSVGGAP